MNGYPDSWTDAQLDDVSRVEMGQSPDSRFYNDRGEGLPFFQGKAEFGALYPTTRKWCSAPTRIAEAGDILLSVRAPVGPTNLAREKCCIGRGLAAIRAEEPISQKYLLHYFRYIQPWLAEQGTGTTFSAIGGDFLRSLQVTIAPLAEQKRIADKLDALLARVDACRERLDRVPLILKRFRQAVLAAATSGRLTEDWREEQRSPQSSDETANKLASFDFADANYFGGYRFPASWRVARLGDIANVAGGITKDTKKQNPVDEELPYLRVANVQRGFLDLREIKTIRVPSQRVDELLLKPRDILFNEGGDLDKLGRGWVWSGEIERCTFQNHVFRVRLHDTHFEPKFFSWYGNSRGFEYFLYSGKQTTNLASINKALLSALPVVVPSPTEQCEIVRRVEALFAYADRLDARYRAARAQVERLTPSLLAKAFRGELVPQDPEDEPASVLLARIRAARASAAIQPKGAGFRASRRS